jgi:hypothetical protein
VRREHVQARCIALPRDLDSRGVTHHHIDLDGFVAGGQALVVPDAAFVTLIGK